MGARFIPGVRLRRATGATRGIIMLSVSRSFVDPAVTFVERSVTSRITSREDRVHERPRMRCFMKNALESGCGSSQCERKCAVVMVDGTTALVSECDRCGVLGLFEFVASGLEALWMWLWHIRRRLVASTTVAA